MCVCVCVRKLHFLLAPCKRFESELVEINLREFRLGISAMQLPREVSVYCSCVKSHLLTIYPAGMQSGRLALASNLINVFNVRNQKSGIYLPPALPFPLVQTPAKTQ